MPNKYERLWQPPQKSSEDDDFEMPWRENFDEPGFGDEEYHKSGQMVEIESAARHFLPTLMCLNPDERNRAINAWIANKPDNSDFASYMAEFLDSRDVYRLLRFWQERTSPFLFMARMGIFSSREQYQRFVARAFTEIGLEPQEFDEMTDEDGGPDIPADWITFVK